MSGAPHDVVIPTAGRASLTTLLEALAAQRGGLPGRVVLVDDRAADVGGLMAHVPPSLAARTLVTRSFGRGPAAARNAGRRACRAPWIAFLDDDVVLPQAWAERLADDLDGLDDDVAGSQGRLIVPLPAHRRATDWERNVAGLRDARWATADLCYRRAALEAVGGFDERFPRAYREDADLGLRLVEAGWRIVRGDRETVHPVGPAGATVSLRKQAGNADDPLMRRLHGRGWRERAGAPPGRLPRHTATAAAGAAALGLLVARRPRSAAAAGAVWAAGTAELAWARIAPGPRERREVATMLATSVAMPFVATTWRLRGAVRARAAAAQPHPMARAGGSHPAAVLLDRDGTLVRDVPYNGDPDAVEPLPGARHALDRLRTAGVALAVVSNQSGIARGFVTPQQVAAVNARVEQLLGPIGAWAICPHGPDQCCACRKPAPGLVLEASRALGVDPAACAVIGDIGADVGAARAAGARAVLVPTPVTRREEVLAAAEVAPDLEAAVDLLLGAEPDAADAAGGARGATPATRALALEEVA